MIKHIKKFLFILSLTMCLCSAVRAHSWTPYMDSLATTTENQFSLPHGICRSFALQESNYDSNATRIESAYFNENSKTDIMVSNYAAHFLNSHPDYDNTITIEKAQLSISFGMFQIMGINYRQLGYNNENINPTLEEQFYYFGKFVAPIWKKLHNISSLAAWYNTGNPNKLGNYSTKVTGNFKRFH